MDGLVWSERSSTMTRTGRTKKDPPTVIGWREWVKLPLFGVDTIKAKIDTGARSSAIHAVGVEPFCKDGRNFVRFGIHPYQRNTVTTIQTEAEVVEYRRVRSSGGHESRRPVVLTEVELMGRKWQIELTLANRDTMGFRMLLGRQAVKGTFVVDPGRSFVGGKQATIAARRKPEGGARKPSQRSSS